MQPGRAPAWNVVANFEAGAWLEAVQTASDDRLPLPAELRKRVSWCTPQQSLPLLAVIQADASVMVSPLAECDAELSALRHALASSASGERPALAFAAMATYARISLQPDGRLRLSPSLSRHLSAAADSLVWVGAHGDKVWLWSDRAWKATLTDSAAMLRDAVATSKTSD